MTPNRRVLVIVLSLALGLGVWAASFSYQAASFSDGEVLSAAVLNALLNDNFQAAADAVDALATEVAGLETALDGKLDTSGGTIDGQIGIVADEENPVLSVEQQGTGPVLRLSSDAGGDLLVGTREGEGTTFTLAADGTITNAVGSGLPVAYGRVTLDTRRADASTDNWSLTTDTDAEGDLYSIEIDGVLLHTHGYTVLVTASSGFNQPRFATYRIDGDGRLIVYIWDTNGARISGNFSFIVFRPGS